MPKKHQKEQKNPRPEKKAKNKKVPDIAFPHRKFGAKSNRGGHEKKMASTQKKKSFQKTERHHKEKKKG